MEFHGRFNRIKETFRRNFFNQVQEKLGEHTVILFLNESKKILLEKGIKRLPGSIYWVDGCMLFLHWLSNYFSFYKYDQEFEIAKTTANRIINFFVDLVRIFNLYLMTDFFTIKLF